MTTTIDDRTVEELAAEFSGELLRAGGAGYDDARAVYNGMFDRRPALIARCRTTADVVAAVKLARSRELLVAVRGGGHSIAGFSSCDDGLVIDLSPMKAVEVDPVARLGRAQPGVVLAELDAATQAFGLATPLGFASPTGIAGLTLNGGIGFLARKHGLTCDNLISAEVVLANGTIVQVSETENADLLWGLRGGGGNFGIVTRFDFRLHHVTEVYARVMFFPPDRTGAVLRHYRDIAPSFRDEVGAVAMMTTVPEHQMFPPELHNQLLSLFSATYVGPEADATEALVPMTTPFEPVFEMTMTMPYQMAQMMQDDIVVKGMQNYWKSGSLDTLTDAAIDTFVKWAPTATSPLARPYFMLLGGAIAGVEPTATAYFDRRSQFMFSVDNIWDDPAENESQIAWTRDFFEAMRPFLNGRAYLNFTVDEGTDRIQQVYGPNHARLVDLKDRYDPTNLFRMNQNIKPSRRTEQ